MATNKNWAPLGTRGVEYAQDAEFTYLKFPTDGNQGPSSTGKTITVASTGGAKPTPAGIDINLNAYRKP